MLEQTITSLEQLASDDPEVAPLAIMYRDTLESFGDPAWQAATSGAVAQMSGTAPLLDEQPLRLDASALRQLMMRMASNSGLARVAPELPEILQRLHVLPFAQAVLEWNADLVAEFADEHAIEPAMLFLLGNTALIPQLHTLAETLTRGEPFESHEHGSCPVCGSWPCLAEQRGLEKQLWLRCARCGTGWKSRHQLCIFCGNTDHKQLGYLAAEGERESRRANTCMECTGYLKVFATVTPMSHAEVLKRDLESLVLDVAATDEGFEQPPQPGRPITVVIENVSVQAGQD